MIRQKAQGAHVTMSPSLPYRYNIICMYVACMYVCMYVCTVCMSVYVYKCMYVYVYMHTYVQWYLLMICMYNVIHCLNIYTVIVIMLS